MTLKPDALTGALHGALKATKPPCGPFCRATAEVEGDHYRLVHNGVRNADTQTVHSSIVLALSKDSLEIKLRNWLDAVHAGTAYDLNAAGMLSTRGPAMTGRPWTPGEEKPW